MRTNTIVKKRVFSLDSISEEEGLILRTLLNLNEKGIKESLESDKAYWDADIESETAIKIGVDICNKIMAMVDKGGEIKWQKRK